MTNPNIPSLIDRLVEEFRKEFDGVILGVEQKYSEINRKDIEKSFRNALKTIDREAEQRGRNEAVDYINGYTSNNGLNGVQCYEFTLGELLERARTLTNKE